MNCYESKLHFRTTLAGGNKFGHTSQDEVRENKVFKDFAKMLQVR